MADTDVSVNFGAKVDDLDKGISQVRSQIQGIQNNTDAMAAQFSSFGETMQEAFNKGEQSVAHMDDTLKALNNTIEKGGNISPTSGLIGLLTTRFGIAGAIIAGVTAGVHALGEEMIKLERSSTETGLSIERFQQIQFVLNAAGVSTDKLTSGLEEVSKKLTNLNYDSGELGKFLDANNIKWKDAEGHVISTNVYLREASILLQRAVAEGGTPLAFKVGEALGLSKELVRTLQLGPVAFDAMVKKANETGIVLDAELIHKAAQFEKEWNESTTVWTTYFKAQLAGLLPYIQELASQVGSFIREIFGTISREMNAASADVAARWAGDTATFTSRFEAAAGSLTVLKGKATELATAATSLSKAWKSSGEEMEGLVATGKEFEKIKFPKDDDKGGERAKFIALYEELDNVKEKYQELKITEQTSVEIFRQTETQKVAHLKAALAERAAAEEEIKNKLLKLAGDDADQKAEIERRFNRLRLDELRETARLEGELLKKSVKEWEGILGGISSSFTSQLRGILQGTTTWAQAVKNIMLDLVIKIIDEFLKLAIIKPLSGMLASALAAPSEIFSSLITIIKNMFGPLLAGFTSFFAPTQGPAAPAEGAAAAAATVAAATAAVALDAGTDYVPRTGMALIHQGEAIIPASENISPYTGGGNPTTFNISAWDGPSVASWLRGGGAAMIAKHVAKAMNSNPTLRPAY